MEHLSAQAVITMIVKGIILLWAVLFIPVIIMIILLASGEATFMVQDQMAWKLMYYNILAFPIVMVASSLIAWILLKKKEACLIAYHRVGAVHQHLHRVCHR